MPNALKSLLLHRSSARAGRSLGSLLLAFGSGLLMGGAPAPLNAFPIAWVSLAPLWAMVLGGEHPTDNCVLARLRRPRASALLLSVAWGMGYHGLALSWILGLHPLTWLGIPWLGSIAITLFCWGFITLWGAALVTIWSWLMLALMGSDDCLSLPLTRPSYTSVLSIGRRILVGVALWCLLEWIWSQGSLYWTALSYTQSPGNRAILHLGQLSGPGMVTAAIVAVNGLLAEAWMRWRTGDRGNGQSLLVAGAVFLVSLHLVGYSLALRPLMDADATVLKVGIVQGNIPTRIKLATEGIQRANAAYTNGYTTLVDQGAQAVLTPEGALPFLWNAQNKATNPFYQAVSQRGGVAWLGTFTAQSGGIARSLLTLGADGQTVSQYNKIKLVPLGEYIPFQHLLGGVISLLTPIDENGLPGTLHQQFDTPFGRAIASICYDSAFPAVFRSQAAAGGQFILTASNLDPYSEVLMAQHQAQDVMRAIETDRWAARATNTGYSGVVDPHGRIVWRSQPRTYQTHLATIYRRQTQTLYVRWGDWLTPVLVILGAIVLLLPLGLRSI